MQALFQAHHLDENRFQWTNWPPLPGCTSLVLCSLRPLHSQGAALAPPFPVTLSKTLQPGGDEPSVGG